MVNTLNFKIELGTKDYGLWDLIGEGWVNFSNHYNNLEDKNFINYGEKGAFNILSFLLKSSPLLHSSMRTTFK